MKKGFIFTINMFYVVAIFVLFLSFYLVLSITNIYNSKQEIQYFNNYINLLNNDDNKIGASNYYWCNSFKHHNYETQDNEIVMKKYCEIYE